MNKNIWVRGFIYGALALITFWQAELQDMNEFADVTPKEWAVFAIGSVAALLIPLRAFIDQTVARENGNAK